MQLRSLQKLAIGVQATENSCYTVFFSADDVITEKILETTVFCWVFTTCRQSLCNQCLGHTTCISRNTGLSFVLCLYYTYLHL